MAASRSTGQEPCLIGETRLNRQQFQRLTDERLADAEILFAAQRWSGAYYLAGYAVECALKACVLAYIEAHMEVLFSTRRYVEDCWSHDINKLVKPAGLEKQLELATTSGDFKLNWRMVESWTERSRYETKSEKEAKDLLAAITDTADGVLPWLKSLW